MPAELPGYLDHDDVSSRDTTSVSEATPLLHSETSSRTSRSISPSAVRPHYQDSQAIDDLDKPNLVVSRKRGIAIMISIYILIFLQASNISGMTMAQSTIAEDLDAYESATWFTSAYLIAMGSAGPLAGRLAAIFSPRAVILATSLFFVIGGIVSSAARSLSVFIVGRVLTGIGGAGTLMLAMILVLELTSRRQRGLFFGLVNAGFTTGVSLGAVVFGGLVSVTDWRFLFWIQSPLGALAGLGVFFSLPATFSTDKGGKDISIFTKLKKIDYLGAVLLTSTLVLFLYGLSGTIQLIPISISLATLVLFIITEFLIADDPIIPLSVLRNRGALFSCIAQLGLMAARWTVLFYAPITALAVFGFTPAASGGMLVPTNLGFGVGGILVGWLHVRRTGSFWAACLVSITLFGVSLGGLYLVSAGPSGGVDVWVYMIIIFGNGLFTGATLNYTLVHLLHLTPVGTHYVATSLLGTFRGFAGSFGSAIGGGIFSRTLRSQLDSGFSAVDETEYLSDERLMLIKRLIGSPALVFYGDLSNIEQQVAIKGYVASLRVLFQATIVLAVIVLGFQAATGWNARQVQGGDPAETQEAVEDHDPELEA